MRTCDRCKTSIEDMHVNALYCKPCRVIVTAETSKKGNAKAREKAKKLTKPCEMCGKVKIPSKHHYCAECRPKALKESSLRLSAKRAAKRGKKPAPAPLPPITAAEIHIRSLAQMGLKVIPGASPAGECRRLTGAEFEAVAAGMR